MTTRTPTNESLIYLAPEQVAAYYGEQTDLRRRPVWPLILAAAVWAAILFPMFGCDFKPYAALMRMDGTLVAPRVPEHHLAADQDWSWVTDHRVPAGEPNGRSK